MIAAWVAQKATSAEEELNTPSLVMQDISVLQIRQDSTLANPSLTAQPCHL